MRMKTNVYLDIEQVSGFNFEEFEPYEVDFYILTGGEVFLPDEIEEALPVLGDRIKLITVYAYKNNEFTIHACELMGEHNVTHDPEIEFVVVSKFPYINGVVKSLKHRGRSCKRIDSFTVANLFHALKLYGVMDDAKLDLQRYYDLVFENLVKIGDEKRPKKLNKLKNHIGTVLNGPNRPEELSTQILEMLIENGMAYVDNNVVSYNKEYFYI